MVAGSLIKGLHKEYIVKRYCWLFIGRRDDSCLHSLSVVALEEDAKSQDPLFAADIAIIVGVKALEHTVQQDVIRHVKGIMQKVPAEGHASISKLPFMY